MTRSPRDTRQALAFARQLGCEVAWLQRTGEIMVSHPSILRRIRINGRRKDAPRKLTAFLADVQTMRGDV